MIDTHHHCLPGVDDGPKEWSEAVEMCAIAAEEGIETIVATPHVLRGLWKSRPGSEIAALLEELQGRVGERPRLLLGSEYWFAHDVVDVLASGSGIIPLAGSRYVLLEFAANVVPPMIEQVFYRLQMDRWTPVIAHPERNLVFQAKPDLLASLVRLGAKTQITASSVVGGFGARARASATAFLRAGLVHVIASDAHDTRRRPPRVREALAAAAEIVGSDVVHALTVRNPEAIVAGRSLEYEPEPRLPSEGGLWRRLTEFWKRVGVS